MKTVRMMAVSALLIAGIGLSAFVAQTGPAKTPAKSKAKKTAAKSQSKPKEDESKITWYSMTDGFAKAKKEKKMLVIDVYTDWCGWCKVMDKKTYEDPTIVKKMNEYYVAVKFNPEVNATHVVNGESMNSDQLATYLAKGGRIPGYPSTFIWKNISNQKDIAPYSGYIEPVAFNEILNKYIQTSQE